MRKILACTSIRSDYDLMSSLYRLLDRDSEFELKLLVSGAHLSQSHGYSVEQIKDDGFDILIKLETVLSSDSVVSRIKSASLLLQNSVEFIEQYAPDLIIFAGDREDVLVYSMIGGYLNIPTVHFFAGDHVVDGYIDNPVRHAAAKMSSAHCVALSEHKQRLVRMGEKPERICVTGNLALDRLVDFVSLSKHEIRDKLDIQMLMDSYALVIFHPVTQEADNADLYFTNILDNLLKNNIQAVVSYPNIDHGNHKLIKVIQKYSQEKNIYFYKNLNRELFLSIYKQAMLIIGNSSSGICEAASLKIPAINVGSRQTGRYADKNVIFCGGEHEQISKAIKTALSPTFQDGLKDLVNSYGSGDSAQKAYEFIKNTNFNELTAKIEDPLQVELQ